MRPGELRPVAGAFVLAVDGAPVASTDPAGHFTVELPAGEHPLRVRAPGFVDGAFTELLRPGERVSVVYALRPRDASPYETVVEGERERAEVTRTTLRDHELRSVPGTVGDPLRVVMLLPGVSAVVSGTAPPVVRGTAPASTGFFIDGIQVPQLFHAYLGPSVVHPDFIESLDFYPGAPPPRFEQRVGQGRLRLFAFGSSDAFGTRAEDPRDGSLLDVGFHRVDLRYRAPLGPGEAELGLAWGIDATTQLGADGKERGFVNVGGARFAVDTTSQSVFEPSLRARASWTGPLVDALTLRLGADVERREAGMTMHQVAADARGYSFDLAMPST